VVAASAAIATVLVPDVDVLSVGGALAVVNFSGAIAASADVTNCLAFKSCDTQELTIDAISLVPGLGFVEEAGAIEQGAVAGYSWLVGVLGLKHYLRSGAEDVAAYLSEC
jgi:hypothetical protein